MRKNVILIVGEVALAVVTLGITVYNIIKNPTFFTASIGQIITIIVALWVAFWATQYKTDQRKAKENAECIIKKIQELVTDEHFYIIRASEDDEETRKHITTINRKIANCISILVEYSKVLGFQDEAQYIASEFKEYKTLVSDYIEDFDYLSKSESRLRKFSENIDSKCDGIIVSLYV
jgi:lipopolysaccharide export LptBFGC system permease protein LptF